VNVTGFIGPVAGSCQHSNESSGYIKCGEFLDQMSEGRLPKKNNAEWSDLISCNR